ncbi:MAG: hypothetical protein J4G04_06130, partial [Nitrosopumilaceae archaeon]|nr:hypothetical protein [Nitrosopumilaceae archaeon]
MARLAAGACGGRPDAVPDTEPDAVPDTEPDAVPGAIDTADMGKSTSLVLVKPHTNPVAAREQPSHDVPDSLPYHGKPPPTATA